jgi:hypothetical protein
MMTEPPFQMRVLPPGTLIYPPNKFNQVMMQFESEEDAIIFFEFCRHFAMGGKWTISEVSDTPPGPSGTD